MSRERFIILRLLIKSMGDVASKARETNLSNQTPSSECAYDYDIVLCSRRAVKSYNQIRRFWLLRWPSRMFSCSFLRWIYPGYDPEHRPTSITVPPTVLQV